MSTAPTSPTRPSPTSSPTTLAGTATVDYRVPADGCASYRALYERLVRLEADADLHLHLENNLRFPAVIQPSATAQ